MINNNNNNNNSSSSSSSTFLYSLMVEIIAKIGLHVENILSRINRAG